MRTKVVLSDIDRCMAGKCMGPFCPCLCHTTLKYEHAAPTTRARSRLSRRKRVPPRSRMRKVA